MRKLTEQDLANLIGTVNAGFTIKRARVKGGRFTDSDHYGIVLARNAIGTFATWQFHLEDETPSYYWGHFIEDKQTAVSDYETRQ